MAQIIDNPKLSGVARMWSTGGMLSNCGMLEVPVARFGSTGGMLVTRLLSNCGMREVPVAQLSLCVTCWWTIVVRLLSTCGMLLTACSQIVV